MADGLLDHVFDDVRLSQEVVDLRFPIAVSQFVRLPSKNPEHLVQQAAEPGAAQFSCRVIDCFQPAEIAAAACEAVSVPLNLSGIIRTFIWQGMPLLPRAP